MKRTSMFRLVVTGLLVVCSLGHSGRRSTHPFSEVCGALRAAATDCPASIHEDVIQVYF
jgi:hypothetical protein